VDATGVGRAVCDLFRDAHIPQSLAARGNRPPAPSAWPGLRKGSEILGGGPGG
jgi:hypothetical protein